ncbi:hypothetical protein [Belnapia rosea]|uniref:hypothetical protein n=1 Tax=Belnapia rosea TaxID=938405 RepID=UPI0008842ABC|nr:hypothetical protein [Belnapia rosea]SDB13826.1 hypothetical protein SAMN02927895_00445 [Belnapia rosea]
MRIPFGRSLLLLPLALTACKTPTPQAEKDWVFACPEAGSRVAWDDGRSLVFTGTDPSDPAICTARTATGSGLRLVWGLVEETNSEGRGHLAGMRSLFPARTGANASYTATVSSPGSGIQYPFETRWRVVGFEALQGPAGRFDTVVLERMVNGTGANAAQSFTVRYWLEGVSGILLQRKVELGRGGSSLLRNLQATAISLPPPPPRAPPPPGTPSGPPPTGS